MVSAIGLAAGSGMYFLSSVATIITMITLVTFHTWEKRFAANNRSDRQFVRIITTNRSGAITDVTGYLSLNDVQVKSLNVKRDKEKNRLVFGGLSEAWQNCARWRRFGKRVAGDRGCCRGRKHEITYSTPSALLRRLDVLKVRRRHPPWHLTHSSLSQKKEEDSTPS